MAPSLVICHNFISLPSSSALQNHYWPLFFVFMSTQGFNEDCWLNSITLCTLISINLFQSFFVYDRFFFLWILQTSFWHLSIFILSVKNGRLLCAFCISLGLFNINLKDVSFVAVFCMTLYEVYIEVKIILSPFKPIYEQLLWLHSSISVVNSLLGS